MNNSIYSIINNPLCDIRMIYIYVYFMYVFISILSVKFNRYCVGILFNSLSSIKINEIKKMKFLIVEILYF